MKKKLLVLAVIFLVSYAFSLKVDVDELKSAAKIEFINYTGRPKRADTVKDVIGIGENLSGFTDDNKPFRYFLKYSIIHAVDDSTTDKYDADIFSIDRSARVNHIKNVRRIISGFLGRRYNYSEEDSEVLALFVTYYNAVYRGNIDYFGSKYKNVVLKHINERNAGISTKYYEWPGQTRMLIPLTEDAGNQTINSLDTNELTEDKVIEELKKKDDMGVNEREKIINIKEKEIEKNKKDIAEEKKVIEEDKKAIEKKEEEIKTKKEEIAKIKDEEVKKNEEDKIKKEEAQLEEKKDEVTKKEETVKEKEKKVIIKEEKVAEEKKDLAKDKKEVEIKKEPEKFVKELQKKSEELDKKEQELKEKEEKMQAKGDDDKIFLDKFYYLKIKEYMTDGHYNNEMFIIDAISRKILIKSPLSKICGSKYDVFKEGVVVISYKGDHSTDHNLTLLDLDTLKVVTTGKDNIFWRSFIEVDDNFIYAIIKDRDNYYLGKFNTGMERVAISKEKVDNATFITFYKEFVYINSSMNDILVLNKNDLSLVDKIKPE